MLGFELKAEKWLKHGDSDKVEPFRQSSWIFEPDAGDADYFCCTCHHTWNAHGMLKRNGEIVCPGSWVLKDYDDVIDEGKLE